MEDEWTKVMSGNRLVKFTYVDLPGGEAFLTAQIAGHQVVYSVMLPHAEQPVSDGCVPAAGGNSCSHWNTQPRPCLLHLCFQHGSAS